MALRHCATSRVCTILPGLRLRAAYGELEPALSRALITGADVVLRYTTFHFQTAILCERHTASYANFVSYFFDPVLVSS